eukprot:668264-Pelagomonas_calceolata.AAC.8
MSVHILMALRFSLDFHQRGKNFFIRTDHPYKIGYHPRLNGKDPNSGAHMLKKEERTGALPQGP